MDENNNNNINQEEPGTGFVLQGDPAPQGNGSGTTEQVEKEQQAAYRQPEPMPSDNTYRFQNTTPVREKKPREKSDFKASRFVLGGAVFGVVAAVCFFCLNALFGVFSGGGDEQIQQTEPIQNQVSIASVSGGPITATSDVSGIVDRVMPSIVAITEKSTKTSYFGQSYPSEGAGSGFIVKQDDKELLIVTNNHVVADADEITVQFNDGESAEAEVKGTSKSNDLAVITVPLEDLQDSTKKSIRVATLGSSDDAKVGQMVIAIGNALGYGQSVTVGYLSAKNREVSSSDSSTGQSSTQILIQTDAAINPGNSGGALIDVNGNVIGINSSKYFSYGNTNVEGMGYAIPMSDAVSVINDLMDREVLKDEEKGYLGITGRPIGSEVNEAYGIPEGVYVVAVSDTGAAYKAGIKEGDVITKINNTTVKTIEEVQEIVNNTKVGTKIQVVLQRSDDGEYKEQKVEVTLKSKDTLDGLEGSSDSSEQQDNSQQNNPGEDESQVVPWGGSIY